MTMITAGIHFQFITDNGEVLEKILSLEQPFLGYIVPNLLDKNMKFETGGKIHERLHPKSNYYPKWFKNAIRENNDNPNITWVQEGYRHCCERCFENRRDPYHEHVCLDGVAQNHEKQIEVILKGSNLMQNELGIRPEGYCPPNHLHNNNTLITANQLGFRYFVTRNAFDYFGGLVTLPAYKQNNLNIEPESNTLIIIPESKFEQGQNSPIIATYYDHLVAGKWENYLTHVLNFSDDLSGLPWNKKPKAKIWANDKLLIAAKKLRDLKRKLKQ